MIAESLTMGYRLRNHNDPKIALRVNSRTWHALLDLAEEFGWNPLGTVLPEWTLFSGNGNGREEVDLWQGSYTPDEERLVVLEDALNLADALRQAFLEYEPEWVHSYAQLSLLGADEPHGGQRPAIGAIAAAGDFCQQGAFWVERC